MQLSPPPERKAEATAPLKRGVVVAASDVLCAGMFLALVLVFDTELGDWPYVALMVFGGAAAVVAAAAPGRILRREIRFRGGPTLGDRTDAFLALMLGVSWALVIASWFYGLGLGALNGVDNGRLFRNFFGLLLFLLVPMIVTFGVGVRSIVFFVTAAGVVQCFIGLTYTAINGIDFSAILLASSISDFRTLYSVGFLAIFPPLALGAALRLMPQAPSAELGVPRLLSLLRHPLSILVLLVGIVLPTMSKGYILGAAVLLGLIWMLSAANALRLGILPRGVLTLVALAGVAVAAVPEDVRELVLFSFGTEEGGNAIRSEQFDYLVAETTWWGNGLGSTLNSGYRRDDAGYGFELTYVNLVHKLGFFALPLFGTYACTLAALLLRMLRGVRVHESAFGLGCLTYLLVGTANPLLLSPTAVVLHCCAVMLVLQPYTFTRGVSRGVR